MRKDFKKVSLEEFNVPLDPSNRWVKLREEIPWEDMEKANLSLEPKESYKAYSFQCSLGALILLNKTKMGPLELVEEASENPYFQFFLGCERYAPLPVFTKSALKKFEKIIVLDFNKYLKDKTIQKRDDTSDKIKKMIADMYRETPEELLEKNRELQEEVQQLSISAFRLGEENTSLKEENEKLKNLLSEANQKSYGSAAPKEPKELKVDVDSLTDEQKSIFDKVLSGKNLFITGGAGTGKSYLLRQIIAAYEEMNVNVLVGAPTGMAALNVGGSTLHRLFHLGVGICSDIDINGGNISAAMGSQAYKILKHAKVLIVDEISMCRADYFTRIARILMYEEQQGHHIQVILCGDFFQLAPVVNNRERDYFQNELHNPEGWAFLTPEWTQMKIETCQLTKVIRQENPNFAHALNMVRMGKSSGLKYIASHASGDAPHAITLCGTNKAAEAINNDEMAKLDNPVAAYEAKVVENPGDLDIEKEIKNITSPVVRICDGARVLITMNDPSGLELYHNGSMGVVVSHTDDTVRVLIDDTGETVDIGRFTYQVFGYSIDWNEKANRNVLDKKVLLSFSQIPIRLGWAITVHKSQGQTYTAMNLKTDSLWPGEGLLYVALSRVVDTSGLRLIGNCRYMPKLNYFLRASKAVQVFYGVQ